MLVGIEGSRFKVFYVIGNTLSGELFRMQTGFVEFANRVDPDEALCRSTLCAI